MSRKKKGPLTKLVEKLGSTTGTIISICTLLGMGFTAGIHYEENQKNLEILELQKANLMELKNLNAQLERIQFEKKMLELDLKKNSSKSTSNGI